MRMDRVLTRNRIVTVVTAIIVAACLLFAYLTQDDSDVGPRTVEEIGDYVEYGYWYGEDGYTGYKITLISVEDGDGRYLIERDGVYTDTVVDGSGLIAGLTVKDASWDEPIDSEYLCTVGGDILCEVYKDDTGRYLVSDGLIQKGITDDGTYIVFSTSMGDREAPKIVSARSDLMENDYLAIEYRTGNSTHVLIDIVDSVDGDTVDITTILYGSDGNGTGKEVSQEEYGIGEYLGFYFLTEETRGEWTTDGRMVLLPTEMGNVLCNMYTLMEYRMWVGVSDNLAYRIDYSDGFTTTVIGTSLVCDGAPAFDRSPANVITEGFSDTRSTIVIGTDRNGVHMFTCDTEVRQVNGMEDGMADVRVTCLPWMEETIKTIDADDLSSKADISGLGIIRSVSVSETVFGTKLCIVTYDIDDSIWSSDRVDVFSDIRYCSFNGKGADVSMWYLTDSDEVDGNRTYDAPRPGDAFMYRCEDSNGDVFEELYCTYHYGEMRYVASDSDGFTLLGNLDTENRYVGIETIDTAFGELECDVYEVFGKYDIVRKVYMADGFICPVYFEYTYDGYDQKGELVYVSKM
ncbi:MAG: hypothetical protein ACI38Y_05295 [Candidatus Methanomethylophilaceae archaeon]